MKFGRFWKVRLLWNEFRWALVKPRLPWRFTVWYMWHVLKDLYMKVPE